MDTPAWSTNALLWLAIAMSAVVLWRSRAKILSRPSGRAVFQVLIGGHIAVALVAVFLTLFTIGYADGKAQALEDNRADDLARIS